MSFIDTLKSLLGFTAKEEVVEEAVPMMETPDTTPTPEPLTQAPVEETTVQADMGAEAPVMEAPVETVAETTMPTENQ